jgi:methyl-accepting chemotaxis protein WspA
MNLIQSVDKLLFRYSYSGKAKFIIVSSCFVALIIFFLFIQAEKPLTNSLKQQIAGSKYEILFLELLKNTFEYNLLNVKSKIKSDGEVTTLQSKIDTNLQSINIYNLEFQDKIDDESTIQHKKIEFNLDLLNKIWTQLKIDSQISKKDTSNQKQMIIVIGWLMEDVGKVSGLILNIDIGTHYLINALLVNLKQIQKSIYELIPLLSIETPTQSITAEDQMKVLMVSELIKQNTLEIASSIQNAYLNNKWLENDVTNTLTQSSLKRFYDSSEILTNVLSRAIKTIDPKKSIALSLKALEDSFELSLAVSTQINSLLNLQLNALLVQQRVGWNCIVFGMFIILVIYWTKVTRKPLTNLKKAADRLARGDLAVRVDIISHDEVALMSTSFNEMADLFEEIMEKATEITHHLASSSSNIFSTAKQLEANVINQEEAIHQIASNAKEIADTVSDFANSLKEVNKTATVTSTLAFSGRTSIVEMETTMQQMVDASKNIVLTLSNLQDNVSNINLIISAIVKIADQSNLLSLNTAIRAGKTGIKGIGFSVVADKIRELADQIASVTLEIEEMVKEIVFAVSDTVETVDKFTHQIRLQVEDATEVGEQLKALIGHTQEQIGIFEEVNIGMQEQTKGASFIHEALILQSEASRQTTHSISKLYREIEYLYHATNNLLALTKKFTINTKDKSPPKALGIEEDTDKEIHIFPIGDKLRGFS